MTALLLAALMTVNAQSTTSQAAPPPDRLFRVLVASYGTAHVVDASLTMFAIGRYPETFREANPALRWTEERPVAHGLVKGALGAGVTIALVELHKRKPRAARWATVGVLALQAWVVVSNARHLDAAGHR